MSQKLPTVVGKADSKDSTGTVRLEVLKNPFSAIRTTHILEASSKDSLATLLHKAGLSTTKKTAYAVCIDGVPVPEDQWEWIYPHEAKSVSIRTLPRGNGKNIGLIIAGVLLVIVGAVLIYFGQGYIGGPLISLGVGLISGGTMGLLAPAIKPPKVREEDPIVHTITGTRNQANPFGSIPVIFGYNKVYPPYGAVPYTELFDNEQFVRMYFVVGYGPVEITDIKIGETPIDDYDDVEYSVLEGRAGDGSPLYYTRDVAEESFDVVLNEADSWTTRTTAVDTEEIIFDLVAPQGLLVLENDGSKSFRTVVLEAEYAVKGSGSWVAFPDSPISMGAESGSTLRRSFRQTVSKNQYDVRVRRTTPDTSNEQVIDEIRWMTLRSFRNTSPINTTKNLASISLRIRATNQLNGVIDRLNCIAKTYYQVYNPATESWEEQLSNNPAWAAATILAGPANGNALARTRIDTDTFVEWADWCTDNSMAYNQVVDTKRTVFELLRESMAAGRATFHMKDELYSVVRDVAQTVPVQHITPKNSWGYEGQKVFILGVHALRVSFIDEASGYQPTERIVYADGYEESNATLIEELPLPGVTNADQVWKLARYHMAQILLRPEVHTLNMDIESLIASRGDLVEFVHDVPKFGLGSGIITQLIYSSDNLSLVGFLFDEEWLHEASKSYGVRVRQPTGDSLLINVDTVPGANDGVTFETPIPLSEAKPAVGDLVLFGERESVSVRMIVKTIEPTADLTAKISLVDEAPGVLTADTGTIPAFNPRITQPADIEKLVPPVPTIISIVSNESVMDRGPDGTLRSRMAVSLFIPGNTRFIGAYYFQIQYRLFGSSDPWTVSPIVAIEQAQVIIDQVSDGETYTVRARTTTALGRSSDWTDELTHIIVGKAGKPPDVDQLFVLRQPDGTREFSWVLNTEPPDLAGYRLRYQAGSSGTWSNSLPLHTGLIANSPFETNQLAAGQYTFLIKAVDTTGNESENAKLVISTIGDPRLAGALVQVGARGLGWPGTKTDCVVDTNGDLVAGDSNTWDDFASGNTTWDDWTDFILNPISPIVYEHDAIDLGAILTFTPLVTVTGDGTPTITESHSDDDISYTSFAAISGQITARYVKIKVSLAGSFPKFTNIIIVADATALVEEQSDVDMSTLTGTTGDRRLSLTKSFSLITSVQIALQNVGAGYSVEIIDKSVGSGPRIKVYDSTDTLADATIDVVIRGIE